MRTEAGAQARTRPQPGRGAPPGAKGCCGDQRAPRRTGWRRGGRGSEGAAAAGDSGTDAQGQVRADQLSSQEQPGRGCGWTDPWRGASPYRPSGPPHPPARPRGPLPLPAQAVTQRCARLPTSIPPRPPGPAWSFPTWQQREGCHPRKLLVVTPSLEVGGVGTGAQAGNQRAFPRNRWASMHPETGRLQEDMLRSRVRKGGTQTRHAKLPFTVTGPCANPSVHSSTPHLPPKSNVSNIATFQGFAPEHLFSAHFSN